MVVQLHPLRLSARLLDCTNANHRWHRPRRRCVRSCGHGDGRAGREQGTGKTRIGHPVPFASAIANSQRAPPPVSSPPTPWSSTPKAGAPPPLVKQCSHGGVVVKRYDGGDLGASSLPERRFARAGPLCCSARALATQGRAVVSLRAGLASDAAAECTVCGFIVPSPSLWRCGAVRVVAAAMRASGRRRSAG